MLKIPIITKLIYRGESMWMGQCSALAMRVECLQFVLFLNIGVGGGDNSVQQFIGLLELFLNNHVVQKSVVSKCCVLHIS